MNAAGVDTFGVNIRGVQTPAGFPVARSGVVYYIDASYFIFRAYHSMPPDMVDRDGNATHALYGFARFLCDFVESVRPAHLAVAFDESLRGESSFRCCI